MKYSLSLTNRLTLILGFSFLHAPILLLVIFSFNASRLVTVWGGFSTQWYSAILRNAPLMDSVWVSLSIATLSATLATVFGTALALALARLPHFRGRSMLGFLGYAPLVLPEIILGLALLLLFIALGFERGFWTIVIAHTTLTTCFVAVVVRARLSGFDPALEDAAIDLGASRAKALWSVTIPLSAPGIVAGWLLAFTLSLDDLVLASFTSGPGATTLPMRIYSQVRLGVTPEINAISTLLILAVATTVVAVTYATARKTSST